jgi:hypothetical protein
VAGLIQQVGDYMSANEVRERLDLPPIDDDEIGESYRSPAEEDTPADEQGGGFNALFSDGRMLNTPEGVPENAISITDRSEAPEDANIVTGPGGGLFYVPSGAAGAGTEDIEDRANEDGTISAEDLVEGDVVIFDDEEITIQGVGTDETGTVVQFIDASGEEYFIYEDLLGDFTVPGATDEDAETEPEAEPDADDESVFTEGETVTTTNGEEVTVVAYDEDTDVVLVELDDGEEILQTGDSIRDDAETETDATSERIADEVGLPDNVSVNLSELDEERANSVIEGLQRVDEALEIEEGDIFSLTTRPPDDVNGVAAAAFHTGNRTFYVNPDASTGEDRRADYEAGFLSTPTQQGNIMHEMIHSKHSRAALSDDNLSLDELREDNFSQDQKQTIRNEVSDYAATNGMEFVAEVGAGVLSGEEYSDEVMELYNNLGGPEVNT